MKKYRCIVCDWIYDPEVGDPEGGIAPAQPLRISPKIGCAPSAALAKTSLKKWLNNSR